MRKIIAYLLILLLTSVPLRGTHAQSADTPADLLPAGTLVYVEMPGGELPADLDTLIGLLAPAGFTDSAESLLANTPFSEEWMGERVAVGVFSTFDLESVRLWDALPTAAIIVEVADEDAADAYLEARLGSDWYAGDIDADLTLWTLGDILTPRILRAPGFMALGTPRGIDAIVEQWQSPGQGSLADEASFASLHEALSPDPIAWMVTPPLESGVAFYASDSALSIETLWQGPIPSGEVPAALNSAALEGVPINAIFVHAGMNANIGLQASLDQFRALLLGLAQLDERLAVLPLQFEFGMLGALGVNVDQELIPLFDGGYAIYAARDPGVTVEGGLILAPNDAQNLPNILARLTSQVAAAADLTLTPSGDAQVTLSSTDGLLRIAAGTQDDRLYLADEIGAEGIRIALDDGPNILDSSRWVRALEAAPPGAQVVTYLNARELLDLLIVSMQRSTQLPTDSLAQAITYAKRFESAAMFQRSDANGVHLMRFVLLFN